MLWFFLGTGVVYALVGQRVEAITLAYCYPAATIDGCGPS